MGGTQIPNGVFPEDQNNSIGICFVADMANATNAGLVAPSANVEL